MYKIFIVEDDPVFGDALERQLSHRGYQVRLAKDFQNILAQFEAYQPHLVLLDVSLPFFDGFYWCGEIRRVSQTPILFLTCAGDEVNLVMAVNEGADDLIPKPFRIEAVLAKIQAMLRRAYSFGGQQDLVRYEDISLNPGRGVVCCGEAKVQLTKNESQILQMLLESRGEIVPRESIMKSLWEDESFIDENTLTVNVARLRKKLKEMGMRPFIGTQKGIGYFVRADA